VSTLLHHPAVETTEQGHSCAAPLLVVEDDEAFRGALCTALEEEGFDVECAKDGIEAMDYLRGGKTPCVVLLDLMMPRMNGWKVLTELRNDAVLAAVPVIVMSAGGRATLASAPGAAAYFAKPFDWCALLDKVTQLCAT
jgi:DNA-binding response OmpR family regulator